MRFMNKQCLTSWHPFTDVKVEDKAQQCASQGYAPELLTPVECYEDEHNCCLEFVDCNLGSDEMGANHPVRATAARPPRDRRATASRLRCAPAPLCGDVARCGARVARARASC
jgi:hypothetical protein